MQRILKSLALVLSVLALAGCATRVPVGEEGIKVNQYGGNRGVQSTPIVTGTVWFNPMTDHVYTYPVRLKVVTYSNKAEGDKGHEAIDESLSFTSAEGSRMHGNWSLGVQVIAGQAPQVFKLYGPNYDYLVHTVVRNAVREAVQRVAPNYTAMGLLGKDAQSMMDSACVIAQGHLEARGVHIEGLQFLGSPWPEDGSIMEQINKAIATTQAAIAAENMVRQRRAEAEQAMAVARGDSAAAVIRKSGEAEGNRRLAISVSPMVVQYLATQKWNGTLPQFTGTSPVPFLAVGK